jgi:hypothetical protein
MLRAAWTGEEWQAHCRELLAMKYGEDVQFVPDRDRGDDGLEAYRLDDGVAYQCYAAQDAYNVRSLTEAQKRKIHDDLRKLVDHPVRTAELIGPDTVLRRWVLLTPSFDSKELVRYARGKSRRIRQDPRPPWCHTTFEIVVHTDELFALERAVLYGFQRPALDIEVPSPTQEEVRDSAAGLDARLRPKLSGDRALAASPSDLDLYRDELILDFVRGGRQRSILENDYSSSYFAIRRAADATLTALTRIMYGSQGSGPHAVEELCRQLASEFHAAAPALSEMLCKDLARYYIAQWFIDCPLRFAASL